MGVLYFGNTNNNKTKVDNNEKSKKKNIFSDFER